MGEESYMKLASDSTLYPLSFIERHGQQSSHWELENWQRRERSLCHDMVCILLANLEPSENLEDAMIKSLKRKAEHNIDEGHHAKKQVIGEDREAIPSSYIETEECETESEDEADFMPKDDYSDEEYDPDKDLLDDARVSDYRYIVLEGLSTASDIQTYFARKWGMCGVNKMFDIIDTKEKKLIEVKTTVRVSDILDEYSKNQNTGQHTSLITVDLVENFIDVHGKNDEMPGTSKAYNFLIKRKATMKILGIEDRMHDETPLEKILFRSTYIKDTIASMISLFNGNIDESIEISDIDTSGFKIEPITPELLFKLLRKPLCEVYEEYCTYKGKIAPFFLCKATELEEPDDLYAVDSFILNLVGDIKTVSGDTTLVQAVQGLTERWMDNNNKNKHFGFIDLNKLSKRESLDPNIRSALMIGKKGKVHNSDVRDVSQPEREMIKMQQYPPWYEPLYEEMSKPNELGECDMGSVEEKSRLSMYEFIGGWLSKFYKDIGSRNVGGLMDQIGNFYSRLSGTYNTSIGNKTTHSNIACIPIKMNTIESGIAKRFITGIVFRGPHHTRSATDKSNLLVVEEINSELSIPENFYRNPTIIEVGGRYFIIRKTAVKKIDGIHLTFIKNALFIASNMIGDIIMKHQQFISEDAFKALCASHISNEHSKNFFVDRVIDACLMAILGNSRDEGYMAMFRKMLMILLNERRQQHSFTFDVAGMCNKMNECIIDNPFSMFIQNSLLYMICNMTV